MMARWMGWFMAVVCLAGAGVALVRVAPRPGARQEGALFQSAYVWQRLWNRPVREAVNERGGAFSELIVLGAEVHFERGVPKVVRVDVPWESLAGRRIGVALRVGSFGGPFREDDAVIRRLREEAGLLLKNATDAGVRVVELQIDFDAAESRLAGYGVWLEALRRCGAERLTITALPSWLDAPGFGALVGRTDGYVLQVHSFSRPGRIDDHFSLCDAGDAWRATERAARFGVPFVVALPTYGYDAVFDARGKFVRAIAETARAPGPPWRTRRIEADAPDMARLIRHWTTDRPALMRGVIWYRLPTAQDRLNWSWTTLKSVMRGVAPYPQLEARVARAGDGALFEIVLDNKGTDAAQMRGVGVRVDCNTGQLVAGDVYQGFGFANRDDTGMMLVARPDVPPLAPASSRPVGWLPFQMDTEVQAHVITNNDSAGADGGDAGTEPDVGVRVYGPE